MRHRTSILAVLALSIGAAAALAAQSAAEALFRQAPGRAPLRVRYQPSGPGTSARDWAISVMSLDGKPDGTPVLAQRDRVAPLAWSPDARYLLYMDERRGPLVQNVQSRESWPLDPNTQPADWAKYAAGRADWSSDGRFIVIERRPNARAERLSWSGVTAAAVSRLLRQPRAGS